MRVDRSISESDKIRLGIKVRATKLRARKCPQLRPQLFFRGSLGIAGTIDIKHQLEFRQVVGVPRGINIVSLDKGDGSKCRPAGAARIELYVELVEPNDPIPKHPAELSGGRLWYLGSYSRNPIIVQPPIAQRSMRVLYWARWAGFGNNDVGPFSATCVADLQGAPLGQKALVDQDAGRKRFQSVIISSAVRELPDCSQQIDQLQENVAGLLELEEQG